MLKFVVYINLGLLSATNKSTEPGIHLNRFLKTILKDSG